MPCSEVTNGLKSAKKFKKKLTKKGYYTKVKTLRKDTPTADGYHQVCWSKTKRSGFKKY